MNYVVDFPNSVLDSTRILNDQTTLVSINIGIFCRIVQENEMQKSINKVLISRAFFSICMCRQLLTSDTLLRDFQVKCICQYHLLRQQNISASS